MEALLWKPGKLKRCEFTQTTNSRCEFTNSGGWTVIQYRHDGSQDFYQAYEAYKQGFGDVKSEHWLGLEAIHKLTMDANGNPKDTRVKVELIDVKNHKEYVEYDDFYIYGEETGYRWVTVGTLNKYTLKSS